MILIYIDVFPYKESFEYCVDKYKSIKELKVELIQKNMIKEEEYYIEKNSKIMNNDMILKDNRFKDYCKITIIRSDYIIIKIKVKDYTYDIPPIHTYVHKSFFKVIKANENKKVTVCDIIVSFYFI